MAAFGKGSALAVQHHCQGSMCRPTSKHKCAWMCQGSTCTSKHKCAWMCQGSTCTSKHKCAWMLPGVNVHKQAQVCMDVARGQRAGPQASTSVHVDVRQRYNASPLPAWRIHWTWRLARRVAGYRINTSYILAKWHRIWQTYCVNIPLFLATLLTCQWINQACWGPGSHCWRSQQAPKEKKRQRKTT